MDDYAFFLDELRARFQKELDIKDKLEGKATNTITVAGIMAAIFMAFSSQMLDNVSSSNRYFIPAMAILLLELLSTLATVILAIMAYRAGTYQFPLRREEFLSESKEYDKEKIMAYKTIDDANYYKLAKKYLKCIKYNVRENDMKVKRIDFAQYALIGATALIPIFAVMVILSVIS